MSTSSRPGLRWTVPVGAAALVVGGAVLGPVLSASAEVELPARTPEQLLTDLQTAPRVDAFSGTVTQRAALGLPELPEGVGGEYSTDLMSLLTGEHTLKVWADGDKARVALHGTMGESDVITDGSQVWTWSSDDRTVDHLVLPDHLSDGAAEDAADRREALAEALPPVTPEQVTAYVLARLESSTAVTAGENTLVAGRPAYELVLDPTGEATLVGSIRIAVDAGELVPTRVQVFAEGATTPAVEVGFTSLSFATPDASNFTFVAPDDATVEEHSLEGLAGALREHVGEHVGEHGDQRDGEGLGAPTPDSADGLAGDPAARRGAVVGTGWDAVVVTRAPAALDDVDGDLGAFLQTLPVVDGDWGSGRLLTSALFTALLTDDGRLLVGPVDRDTVLAAAGDPAADLG
jgi:outer membrane lipoprotein-sorting protein